MEVSPYNHLIKLIILAVILIRLFLFGLQSFDVDMNVWKAWAGRLIEVGPSGFYSNNFFSDYFPGYLYILWILGEIHNLISSNLLLNTFLFEVLVKSVTTIFDLGTAFYIFKIVSKYQKSLALISVLLYLANPALIFNTSVWGQIDGIFTFFLVFAAYSLTEKKNVVASNIALGFAILIKPQSLAILPIILKNHIGFFKKLIIIPSILVLFSFPFFIKDPFWGIFKLGINLSDLYSYNSLYAFNFWSLVGWWQTDSKIFLNISYQTWGFILYSAFMLLVILPLFIKKTKDKFYFYFSSALSFFIFYLFLTRMHERYLFPFFAFLLITALIKKSKILIFIYLIVSVIHFINLYYVYHYYNYVYLGRGARDALFVLVDKNYQLFSVCLVLIFIILLIIYYRYLQLLNQK